MYLHFHRDTWYL